MVVTIDSKFYSKLQLGISKYQEKTPADPLNEQNMLAQFFCNMYLCVCVCMLASALQVTPFDVWS